MSIGYAKSTIVLIRTNTRNAVDAPVVTNNGKKEINLLYAVFFIISRCDIRHVPIGLGNHAPASGIQGLISTEYIGTNIEPQVPYVPPKESTAYQN